MDISAFTIYYSYGQELYSADILPCCREENVVDYAVWVEGRLFFTVTKPPGNPKWVVALKNADDNFDDDLVQGIGAGIEKRMADKNI